MIYIASDHGGYHLKQRLIKQIGGMGLEIKDMGPEDYDPNDDYPDFVVPLVERVLKDRKNKGIVICKNGVGVNMTANRFKGIRCTLSWNEEHVKTSREDDDTNVLALPAEFVNTKQALEIVGVFLNTSFSTKEKHVRRLDKVDNL